MSTKTYAVTGSASGIGKAVVELLKGQGHDVIDIDQHDATIIADLSSGDGRQACISELTEQASEGLDGFIPCAGVGGFMGLSDKVIEVNYFGSTELLEGCLDLLRRRHGVVVVIGSNSMAMPGQDEELIQRLLNNDNEGAKGYVVDAGVEPYPSAKTALCTWMRGKAVEWIKHGVRMNAIAPGMTETGMVAAQRNLSTDLAATLSEFAESAPIGYAATPDMIADVIGFLLSDAARFIVGEVLYADGGHAAVFRPGHV